MSVSGAAAGDPMFKMSTTPLIDVMMDTVAAVLASAQRNGLRRIGIVGGE